MTSSDENSKTNFFNIPHLCSNCHKNIQTYENSVHNQVIQEHGLTGSPVCTTCHGFHLILPSNDKRAKTHFLNVHKTCGSCHNKILGEFKKSIHGRNLLSGNKNAPTCITCHSEHEITETSRVTLFGLETKECGKWPFRTIKNISR